MSITKIRELFSLPNVHYAKIYNWGTIERISTKTHKKAYAMTYTGKKPADMEVVLGVMGESAGISVSIK